MVLALVLGRQRRGGTLAGLHDCLLGAIRAAADSSVPPPGFVPALFTAGVVSVVVMASAHVPAVALRIVRSRRSPVLAV